MKTAINSVKMFLIPCILILAVSPFVSSHCQVPCGIYDDQMRGDMIAEHITTIEKSITSINDLSAEGPIDTNQVVRWVNNKDIHCDQLSEIVTYYFMAQRVKPVTKDSPNDYNVYISQLSSLHRLLVLSMKAKQGSDPAIIAPMREELKTFSKLYFAGEEQSHEHKH